MPAWLIVALIAFLLLLVGFVSFSRTYAREKKIPYSSIIAGIFLPLLAALFYAETVMELIPQVTLVDLGAFHVTGMISGFFIAALLLQRIKLPPSQ